MTNREPALHHFSEIARSFEGSCEGTNSIASRTTGRGFVHLAFCKNGARTDCSVLAPFLLRHFRKKPIHYENKAHAAANNRAISSDDPDAVQKLQTKLEELEKMQAKMKTINAYYRKHQTCFGCEGVTEEEAARLDKRVEEGYSWETAPYPAYALSNNNQEINRIKKRLETLTKNREVGFRGWEFDGGKVVANDDNNRLQIFFDEIPAPEVREALKGRGFHWARSEGAWQRQLTSNAIYAASHIAAIRPIDGSDPVKIQPKRAPSRTPER